MKMKTGLIISSMVFASMTATAALVDFQLGEASGTTLTGVANSGTISGNFDNDIAGVTADGAGNLHLTGATNSVGSSVSGLGLNSGTISYEVRLDSWNYSAMAKNGGFQLNIKNTAGDVVKLIWQNNKGNADTKLQTVDSANGKINTTGFASVSGADGILFKFDANLDTGTFDSFYKMDSDIDWTQVDSGSAGLSDIDSIGIWMTAPAWNGSTADIDYMSVIPEPATLGLVCSCGAGLLFIRRKFSM